MQAIKHLYYHVMLPFDVTALTPLLVICSSKCCLKESGKLIIDSFHIVISFSNHSSIGKSIK